MEPPHTATVSTVTHLTDFIGLPLARRFQALAEWHWCIYHRHPPVQNDAWGRIGVRQFEERHRVAALSQRFQ